MARLTQILEELGLGDKNPNQLTDEEWTKVSEAMRQAQDEAYGRGERVGMRNNLTPKEQALEDSRNPDLEDPTRGGSERKG